MVPTESALLVRVTSIIGLITWVMPLFTLTLLAYFLEYFTKFKTKWRIFLIASLLVLLYPLEHDYGHWAYTSDLWKHLNIHLLLLIGVSLGGYASVKLLGFQNIALGKTKSVIEALAIVGVVIPLSSYIVGRIVFMQFLLLMSYNISVTLLALMFLTIGKLAYRYVSKYNTLAYTTAKIGAILLVVDPAFLNYLVTYSSTDLIYHWLRFMGVLIHSLSVILLSTTVLLMLLEARVRGTHLLPSQEDVKEEKPMKYRLKRGYGYLVTDYSSEKSFDILIDHVKHGYYGLIIARVPPERIRSEYALRTTPILWMTNAKTDEKSIRPTDLDRLLLIIREFDESQQKCIALIERLDYLITENGFDRALKFIHDLNDIIMSSESIVIVSLDPSTISQDQLSLIRKEMEDVSYSESMVLNETLYDLLEYVFAENNSRKLPSFKNVTNKFDITKTTARKRIYELENKGLLRIVEQGKFKLLEVTERGKSILRSPVGPRGG
ncbi:MAG: DUF835 domain-containing protein [Candidatus Altiarchaeota archaeon]